MGIKNQLSSELQNFFFILKKKPVFKIQAVRKLSCLNLNYPIETCRCDNSLMVLLISLTAIKMLFSLC